MIVLSEDRYHWTLGLGPGEGRMRTPVVIGIPQLCDRCVTDGHMFESSPCLRYGFRLNDLRPGESANLHEETRKFGYERVRS